MKSFKFVLFIIFSILITFVACEKKKSSKLLNEKVTQQNFFSVIEKVKKDSLLTFEELDLFNTAIARNNNNIDTLYNKTVKQIIEQEKVNRRRQGYINIATNAIIAYSRFRYDGWKPVDINGSKFNVFTYTISNISKVNINKISGFLQFSTGNNQLIRAYRINIDQAIPAGQFTQFQSTFRFEQGNRNEELLIKLLQDTPNQVFVSWRPVYIELDNGQKINLEEN